MEKYLLALCILWGVGYSDDLTRYLESQLGNQLHLAAYTGDVALLSGLIEEKKFDIDEPLGISGTHEGVHPLHLAAYAGNLETCRILLDSNADPNSKRKDGW